MNERELEIILSIVQNILIAYLIICILIFCIIAGKLIYRIIMDNRIDRIKAIENRNDKLAKQIKKKYVNRSNC